MDDFSVLPVHSEPCQTPNKEPKVGLIFTPLQDITNTPMSYSTIRQKTASARQPSEISKLLEVNIDYLPAFGTMTQNSDNFILDNWEPNELNYHSIYNTVQLKEPLDIVPDHMASGVVESHVLLDDKISGHIITDTYGNNNNTEEIMMTIKLEDDYMEYMDGSITAPMENHDKIQTLLSSIENMKCRNNELLQKQNQYKQLIEEYEVTISALEGDKAITADISVAEAAYTQKLAEAEIANIRLQKENQRLTEALTKLESKCERLEMINANAAKNEAVLKATLEKAHKDLVSSEGHFLRLRARAQEQLDKANNEISRLRDEGSKHVLLLTAKLSRAETMAETKQMEQEILLRENMALESITRQICQELVAGI